MLGRLHPALAPGVLRVSPAKCPLDRATLSGGRITRTQFMLAPAFFKSHFNAQVPWDHCSTLHTRHLDQNLKRPVVQGTTICCESLVDARKPPHGYQAQTPYVVFSRFTTLEHVVLLEKLTLATLTPNPATDARITRSNLRSTVQRLQQLSDTTLTALEPEFQSTHPNFKHNGPIPIPEPPQPINFRKLYKQYINAMDDSE